MEEYRTGALVRSLAGHDKGCFFIITEAEGEYVYLSDGRLRPLAKTKKKKKKHVQPVGQEDSRLAEQIQSASPSADQEIRRVIKDWKRKSLAGR